MTPLRELERPSLCPLGSVALFYPIMALPFGVQGSRRLLEQIYCKAVRVRSGWRYPSVPKENRHFIALAVRHMVDAGAEPAAWVKAGFERMPRQFCLSTWKIPYPPLFTFASAGAAERWQAWVKSADAGKVEQRPDFDRIVLIMKRSHLLYKTLRDGDRSVLELNVTNGSISPWWVAARWVTDQDDGLSEHMDPDRLMECRLYLLYFGNDSLKILEKLVRG